MDEEPKKKFVVFGRDILKIPCLRNTFLYSIPSYVGVGLVTFLFTSRPALSSHVGFGAFMAVTFGYYTNCRIDYSRKKLALTQIQEALHRAAVLEGTEPDATNPKRKIMPKLEEV